jgi:transcriptional regulator NrdR family protein
MQDDIPSTIKAISSMTVDDLTLLCPRCGCAHSFVLDEKVRASILIRRRECRYCGKRFTRREPRAETAAARATTRRRSG